MPARIDGLGPKSRRDPKPAARPQTRCHVWANCGVPSNAPPPFHCTGTQLVSTAPDAVYHFRAAIAAAGAVQSPCTADVEVHTPSEPDVPPAAPKQLGATARSAFVIQLSWEDASDNEYGFEVQCRSAQSSSFEEVALRNPNEATFVHQGRAPETEYVYRVRAFNPHGWSEFSNEVTVRTPDVAPNAIVPSATPSVPAPCTTLDAVSVQPGRVDWRDGIASLSIVCHGIELGGGHTVDAVSSGCGAQNCSWAIYGVYDGCYRLLGDDFSGVGPCPGFGIVATPRSGWPIISEGRHFSAFESDVELYAFLNGRYVCVDSYGWTNRPRCADPHGSYNQDCKPKDLIPPFLEDQFD